MSRRTNARAGRSPRCHRLWLRASGARSRRSPATSPAQYRATAASVRVGQVLRDGSCLAELLNEPEPGELVDHRLELVGNVAGRNDESIGLCAGHLPIHRREGDALRAIPLPALAPKAGCLVGAAHPLGAALVQTSRPGLVIRDALVPGAERHLERIGHRPESSATPTARRLRGLGVRQQAPRIARACSRGRSISETESCPARCHCFCPGPTNGRGSERAHRSPRTLVGDR